VEGQHLVDLSPDVMGSWKIMEISFPRMRRISSSDFSSRFSPLKITSPAAILPGGSIRPRREKPVTDFPPPDSPTMPRISPSLRVKSTPSTAFTVPRKSSKRVCRFLTSRRYSDMRYSISGGD